ncbi:hypothetical protein BDC45DRAFT_503668 [Circinella umbellata]|nr:hypothetical protein BDC45DRAFT_503668 [Circinella umbellata]
MALNNSFPHYDVFKKYFDSCQNASLYEFVQKNEEYIIKNQEPCGDIAATWNKFYKNAYRCYYNSDNLPKSSKKVNWGSLAIQILKNQNSSRESHTSHSSTTASASSATPTSESFKTSSESASSSSTAPMITREFLTKFKNTYKNMNNRFKWTLPSGLKVEDELFKYGIGCDHEDAAHSFILDTSNPIWLKKFDEPDWQEIMGKNKVELDVVDSRIATYLESFLGKHSFKELMEQARSTHFDPINDFDMDWAQSTIETALKLYPTNYFPLTDQTESDILKRIWIFIEKAFDNLPVVVRSGEMESESSRDRRNLDNLNENTKRHGHRADLLIKESHNEFGFCEAGKDDHDSEGTKLKMLKDMLWSLSSSFPESKGFIVVGIIISGLKISTLLMDRPSPYICRIFKTTPLYFPTNVEEFAAKMGSIIHLVLQIKHIINKTYKETQPKIIRPITIVNSNHLGVHPLPPCPPTPKSKHKKSRTSQAPSNTRS